MKKIVIFITCAMLSLSVAGCGSKSTSARNGSGTQSVDDIMNQKIKEAEEAAAGKNSSASGAGENASDTAENNGSTGVDNGSSDGSDASGSGDVSSDGKEVVVNSKDVDVDLTAMSSTMVYSKVYDMMAAPETYIGKTVKMSGQLAIYHDEVTQNDYYACLIQDATACCAQGIEFELTEEYSFPEDYPAVGEDICVSGTFDTYTEGDFTYCTLRNAKKCKV